MIDRLAWVRRVSVVVVVWTFALMGLGAWVKATGSGLACPDWPQCYGQWLPPFPSVENQGVDADGEPVYYTQAQVLYEWTHRLVASLLGIPFLLLVGLSATERRFHPMLRGLPLVALIVLAVQVLLGGGTVVQGNPAGLTTSHLLTATAFFFLVSGAAFTAFLSPYRNEPKTPDAEWGSPGVVRFPGEGGMP